MKLILRRNQRKGVIGGNVTFTLEAQAQLTDEEAKNVKTYKMGKTLLYINQEEDPEVGLIGAIAQAAARITITVDSLVGGKKIDCKDIIQMIAVENQIKEACENFKAVLDTAAQFGGEQVIEY